MSVSKDEGAGFYKAEYGEPLLQFEVPDRGVREKIRALLAELPIEPFKRSSVAAYDAEHVQARGGLSAIMAVLFDEVEEDYRENVSESTDWRGGFDYVVVESNFVPGAFEILTRLYYDKGSGELYYGRVVQRAARDEFLLWMTD